MHFGPWYVWRRDTDAAGLTVTSKSSRLTRLENLLNSADAGTKASQKYQSMRRYSCVGDSLSVSILFSGLLRRSQLSIPLRTSFTDILQTCGSDCSQTTLSHLLQCYT